MEPDQRARGGGPRGSGLSAPLGPASALAELVGRRVRVERPGGGTVEAEVVAVSGADAGPDGLPGGKRSRLRRTRSAARFWPGRAPGRARPAGVRLKLASEKAGARALTSRYLVADINWQADYALDPLSR